MTPREWVARAWAACVPSYSRGRLDVGRFVICTRKEAQRMAWAHMAMGAEIERERPGVVAQTSAELNARRSPSAFGPDGVGTLLDPPARHLRAV